MMFLTLGLSSLPKNLRKIAFLLIFISLLNGCFKESSLTTETAEIVKLEKQSVNTLSGWKNEDFKSVIAVFDKNCGKILNNKNEFIYGSSIKIKTKDYQKACRKFINQKIDSSAEMEKFLEKEFDVYAVSNNENPDGKFTSYYEAVIHASFKKIQTPGNTFKSRGEGG